MKSQNTPSIWYGEGGSERGSFVRCYTRTTNRAGMIPSTNGRMGRRADNRVAITAKRKQKTTATCSTGLLQMPPPPPPPLPTSTMWLNPALTAAAPVEVSLDVSELVEVGDVVDVLLGVGDDLLGPVLHQVVQQDERFRDGSPVSRRRVDGFPHQPHHRAVAAR